MPTSEHKVRLQGNGIKLRVLTVHACFVASEFKILTDVKQGTTQELTETVIKQ